MDMDKYEVERAVMSYYDDEDLDVIQAERKRLYKLLWERDKQFEAAKNKRTVITILGFTVFYFLLFGFIARPVSLGNIIKGVVLSLIFAGVHFWVNATIFANLAYVGRQENEALDAIRRKIAYLEKLEERKK